MRIIDICKDLQIMDTTSYVTDNGIKNFTSKNGYVNKVYIAGETIVNEANCKTPTTLGTGNYQASLLDKNRCTDGTFTIFNLSPKAVVIEQSAIGYGVANETNYSSTAVAANSVAIVTVTSAKSIYSIVGLSTVWASLTEFTNQARVLIVRGSYTGKSLSYYTGMKSIGDDTNLRLMTYQSNMLDYTKLINGVTDGVTGIVESPHALRLTLNNADRIPVTEGTNFTLLCNNNTNVSFIYFATINGTPIYDSGYKSNGSIIYIPSGAKYVTMNIKNIANYPILKDFAKSIIMSNNYDKKDIETSICSLPNGVKDSIFEYNGKYYKIQLCGEKIIDGTMLEGMTSIETNTVRFFTPLNTFSDAKVVTNSTSYFIADKMRSLSSTNIVTTDTEGFAIKDTELRGVIRVQKTRLLTQDLTGGTSFLNDNPIVIKYELKEPIIIELPSISARTLDDTTTLVLHSGDICGNVNFDYTSNMVGKIDIIDKKMSSLDETITQVQKELRGEILRGITSLNTLLNEL